MARWSTNSLTRTAVLGALGAVALSGAASAEGQTVSIETEYLGTLEYQIDPPQAVGNLLVSNFPSGTIQGPKINGTVIGPSGDWLMPMPDGSLRLDVRGTIKTNDGEFILVEYNGVIDSPKEASDRFFKGEVMTAKDEYCLIAVRFTTSSKTYDWLNKVQAVGKMVTSSQNKIKYDLFIIR
jgi:hypothetical protein